MTDYISEIMRELGFEKEAYDSLHADFLKIQENAFAKAEFEDCILTYSRNFKCDYGALLKKRTRRRHMPTFIRTAQPFCSFFAFPSI